MPEIEPSDAEVIRSAMDARMLRTFTATAGEVVTYDPVRQVADVRCVNAHPFNVGQNEVEHVDLPVLMNVPVQWPRGGGFFVHLGLLPGDAVLLIFTHDSLESWRTTGQRSNAVDLRRHSIANAIAIPGIAPATKPLTDAPLPGMDPTEAVLGGGVYRVGTKTLSVPVALAPIVDAFIELFNAHTHPTGVGPSGPPATPFAQSSAATKLKAE